MICFNIFRLLSAGVSLISTSPCFMAVGFLLPTVTTMSSSTSHQHTPTPFLYRSDGFAVLIECKPAIQVRLLGLVIWMEKI